MALLQGSDNAQYLAGPMASVLAPHLQSRDANTTLRMVAQLP
jgi:hypothetical protein